MPSPGAQALLERALEHHRSRELDAACAAYRKARRFPAARPRADLGLGECLIARGKLAEARRALRPAVRLAPCDGRAWLWLAVAERAAGRLGDAEEAFRRAARSSPRAAAPLIGLGECLLSRGKTAQAETALREALALDPGDAKARFCLALLHWRRGECAAGEAACARALELDPALPGARACLAELRRALGRGDEALVLLREERGLRPRDANAALLLGEALVAAGKPEEAREPLRSAAALGSPRAGLLLSELAAARGRVRESRTLARRHWREASGPARASAALACGDLPAAFRECERILADDPAPADLEFLLQPFGSLGADPDALNRLLARLPGGRPGPWPVVLRAALLSALRDPDAALTAAEPFSRLPARYAFARFLRGRLLLHAGKYAAARKEFAAALARRPAFWKARAFSAEALLCEGRRRDALREMDRAIAAARGLERAQALAWRGELRLWLGDYRRALTDADAGTSGGAPFAFCWRGAARLLLGLPGALEDLDAAIRLNPRDCEALTWRGEARRLAGRPKEALADLDAAVALEPTSPFALANRALVHLALGKKDQAAVDRERIPAEVRDRFTLAGAKGLRRADPYLRPLWLSAGRSKTARSRRRGR
ncbi:MAG TPA: tetratricopeptide repeat protein [Elusimicrobiota bacterium]|jgi:tetratricopeptide (TPR) repeat protein|nr:tetratricopeptide repeat protein [Elusimicrobiota bacterium]